MRSFLISLLVVSAAQADWLGSLTDQLDSPARLAVAANGTVLVTDPFKNQIVRFDAAGQTLGTWSVPQGPIGIAAHPDGRYFVSLRDLGKVAIYDSGFVFQSYLGEGDPQVTFVRPTDIDVATDTKNIYVVDTEGDRVYGFAPGGAMLLKFGVRGGNNGQFRYPSAITVDEPRSRLIVADHDNFRIQIFTTAGVHVRSFGARNKYPTNGPAEGWVPRTQGLAVDATGRIYVADAMMSTVRLFDSTGNELAKLLHYGAAPGDLRTSCDIALNPAGTRYYVVSTNTSSVNIYDVSRAFLVSLPRVPRTPPSSGTPGGLQLGNGPSTETYESGPADWNWCLFDDLRMGNGSFRLPTETDPLDWNPSGLRTTYTGPHIIDSSITCGRCHGIRSQPGGDETTVEGQAALCMSCHTAGGQGLDLPIHEHDLADPYGTNPNAPDGRGRSHAWGVAAVNAAADSVGPVANGQMAQYLKNGEIKCATCHNSHNSDAGSPYLRVSNAGDAMCKECHAPRDEGLGQRGTHPVGFDYPGGTGEFPPDTSVLPLCLKNGEVECSTCHATHNADSGGANGGAGDGMLLRAANDDALCRTCHTEHINHGVSGPWQPGCRDCHDVHDPGSTNLSLVSRTINGTPIQFETNTSGLNDFIHSNHSPPSYDGVCEVCHTQTAHHQNSAAGDHTHYANHLVCTDCHAHSAGFMPTGGSCTDCHGQPQDNGDGVPVGGRRAVVGDFAQTSHHVQGDVQAGDCQVCHDMTQHKGGHVRLKLLHDPNNVIELTGRPTEDPVAAQAVSPFCLSCHDEHGHAPLSDGQPAPAVDASLWNNAAHKTGGAAGMPLSCMGDGGNFGCHGNGHGSPNMKMLSTAAGAGLGSFCYNCHTQGKITNVALSGADLADDIQQAFGLSAAHDLGGSFVVGSSTYSLACTTCHNPHVVTGKHWDAGVPGVSPITRPAFGNPTANPRAVGAALWGGTSAQKMNAYTGAGTYRTPDGDAFAGSALPDYVTFCQDCHAAMPAPSAQYPTSHGGISWDNDHHGRRSANVPNGGGTTPDWFACGKAEGWDGDDCIGAEDECWPVMTRGKGEQIFSRGPYNQEERIAGANFTLSCTDCHEAHGSNVRSTLRSQLNAWAGSGTTIWNSSCNACHYYYSDWHAGMSCANASCHVSDRMSLTGTATPHNMSHASGDGSTRIFNPDLVADFRFENNLNDSGSWRLHGRWADTAGTYATGHSGKAIVFNGDQPVEIGTRNAYWSTDEGYHGTWKYTEMKYNMTLEAWVYPTSDTQDENHIFSKHTYLDGGYAFMLKKMDGTLRAALLTNVTGGGPTWGTNGWDNGDCNGLRGAYSTVDVPLNRWTHVAATFDWTLPDRDPNNLSVGRIRIYVNGEDVTTSKHTVSGECYSQPGPGEQTMFPYSQHSPGNQSICYDGHWCASACSIGGLMWGAGSRKGLIGRLDDAKIWNITRTTADFATVDAQSPPRISRGEGLIGSAVLAVTFSEGVYANLGGSGALTPADFVLTDLDNGRSIVGVAHVAGSATAVLTLNSPLDNSDDLLVDRVGLVAGGAYDEYNNAADTTAVVITSSTACPAAQTEFTLNEPAGSAFVKDDTGLLIGAANDPADALPGDGYLHGDGVNNYVDFEYNPTCLQASTAMTLEARVRPSGMQGTANYIRRILARDASGNYQLSVWRNNTVDSYMAPDGVSSFAFWVRPVDAHGGQSWKPVLTKYELYPIVSDHWYKVRVVWNSSKTGGIPCDIFVDDQGLNGDDVGENWSGFINCTNSEQSYLIADRQLHEGDEIMTADGPFTIGANVSNHANNVFLGLIDWITWQSIVTYDGLDDPPPPGS
jgi:hypothetical protein